LREAEERLLRADVSGDGPSFAVFKGKKMKCLEEYTRSIHTYKNTIDGCFKQIKDKEFHGSVPAIEQITVRWLRRFEDFMRSKKGLSDHTIYSYTQLLSTVCRQALEDEYVTRIPFGEGLYRLPVPGKTEPVYLVEAERETLLNGLLKKTKALSEETYRVLAYMCLGMCSGLRFCDWELFDVNKHIVDNKLKIKAKKNKTTIVMELLEGEDLKPVIEVIRKVGPLNLPYTTVLKHLDIIRGVFEIETDFETHAMRHTFGYYCASIGLSEEITAYYMGITVKVVKIYYHLTDKHVEAHRRAVHKAAVSGAAAA
jgi:integrase